MSRLTIFVVIVLAIILAPVLLLIALSTHSQLQSDPQPKAIGQSTPVKIKVSNPHGIRHVTAWVEQDGARTRVFDTSNPSTRLFFLRKHEPPREVAFNASVKKEGKARLIVDVTANDFRGATDTTSADGAALLPPPSVVADGVQHYINQGGSELAVFTPAGLWNEAGVRTGKYTFRSFPKPGSPNERFYLFASPGD